MKLLPKITLNTLLDLFILIGLIVIFFHLLNQQSKGAEGDQHVVVQCSDGSPEKPTGCGTVIMSNDQASWVITAHHVISYMHEPRKIYPRIVVSLNDGRSAQAKWIGSNVRNNRDIALLAIPLLNLTIAPIADEISSREEVWVVGRPWNLQGDFRVRRSRHIRGEYLTGGAISGDSGGGIFNKQGYLVGVVSGTTGDARTGAGGELVGCYGQPIKDLVEEVKKTQCPGGVCPRRIHPDQYRIIQQVPTPDPPSSNPNTPSPDPDPSIPDPACKCTDEIIEIKKELSELKEQFSEHIEHSVVNDDVADQVNTLQLNIENHHKRLTSVEDKDVWQEIKPNLENFSLQLPEITVRYLNGDGSIYDQAKVGLGGTLDIKPTTLIREVKIGGNVSSDSQTAPVGGVFEIWDEFEEAVSN